jgi:hypothetical protein
VAFCWKNTLQEIVVLGGITNTFQQSKCCAFVDTFSPKHLVILSCFCDKSFSTKASCCVYRITDTSHQRIWWCFVALPYFPAKHLVYALKIYKYFPAKLICHFPFKELSYQ